MANTNSKSQASSHTPLQIGRTSLSLRLLCTTKTCKVVSSNTTSLITSITEVATSNGTSPTTSHRTMVTRRLSICQRIINVKVTLASRPTTTSLQVGSMTLTITLGTQTTVSSHRMCNCRLVSKILTLHHSHLLKILALLILHHGVDSLREEVLLSTLVETKRRNN